MQAYSVPFTKPVLSMSPVGVSANSNSHPVIRNIVTREVTISFNSQGVTYGSDDRNTSTASDVGIHSRTLPPLTVNSHQVLVPKWARTWWQTIDRLA